MNATVEATVLFVPGLRQDVPDHWQTLLQATLPRTACVPRRESLKLSCSAWVADLDRSINAIDGPIVLAAHSAGVTMVAHWAKRHRRPIQGALLATPPDLDRPLPPGYPTREALQANGWMPVPLETLPFPSVVAASTNDTLASFDRVAAMAQAWGSVLVDVGAVGHLNSAAGYGEWPHGEALLRELL